MRLRSVGLASALLAGIATGASSPVVATELLPRTELVSVSSNEERGNDASISPAISADGSRIAFASSATNLVADDTNCIADIFVRNLSPGTTARVSLTSDGREIEGGISRPAISGNGQWVAYSSDADGIVPGDDNHVYDVFLRSLRTGATMRASEPGPGGRDGAGRGSRPLRS